MLASTQLLFTLRGCTGLGADEMVSPSLQTVTLLLQGSCIPQKTEGDRSGELGKAMPYM